MFTDIQLSTCLFTLGLETASTVREFTDGMSLAVYEGRADERNDAKLREGYEKAVEAVRVWLRAVLAAEIIDSRADISVEAQLLLPDRMLEVGVRTSEPPFCRGISDQHKEMLITPIGRVSYFTYRAIIENSENPVRVLFESFQKLLHQMHSMAAAHGAGKDCLLSGQALAANNIVDVLGVYKFDSSWHDVNKFFEGAVHVNEG